MAEYKDSRLAFINTAAKSLGIAPGIVAAHVQLEVGSGSKTVGQFNFANIKAGKSWTGATAGLKALEYDAAGNAVREPSQFRAYQSPEEAGADYAALLQRRYPAAVGARDAASFATALKSGGYATDPNYVNKFIEVAGGSIPAGAAPQAAQATPAPRPAMQRLDDPLAEVMPGKARYPTSSGSKATDLSVPATPQVQGADQVAEARVEANVSAVLSKEQDVSFLEQSKRAFISYTLAGSVLRKQVAGEVLGDNLPDPSFKVDVAALRGKSGAEQEYLQGAQNAKDYEYRVWATNQQREDTKLVSQRGTGRALLAGLVAGLPEGAASGMVAARTMSLLKAGSAAHMAQGRTSAAVGSLLAENAGLEVLMATAQNKIDPFFTTEDAVVQVGVGTLLGAAFGSASLIREGTAAPRLEALQAAQASARLSQVLPEHADAQQAGMAAEAAALRAQEDSISRAAQPPESPVLPEIVRPDFDYKDLPEGKLAQVGKGEGANDPFTAVPRMAGYEVRDARTLQEANQGNFGDTPAVQVPSGQARLGHGFADAPLAQAPRVQPRLPGPGATPLLAWSAPPSSAAQRAQVDTPEFKEWFGSSVVSTEGKPQVMYHGTRAGALTSLQPSGAGQAIFVSPEARFASEYASTTSKETSGGAMYPVFVRAERPFDIDTPEGYQMLLDAVSERTAARRQGVSAADVRDEVDAELQGALAAGETWDFIEVAPFVEKLRGAGYDSYFVHEQGIKNLAVFDSNQVKSATGNSGAFSLETAALSLSKDDPSVFSKLFSALARVFKREDDFGTMGRADTSFEGWDSANVWSEREKAFSPGGKHAEMIPALTFGKFQTLADLDALPAGIHLADKLKNYGMAKTAAESLTRRFLGKDFKLVIADADGALKKAGANGAITHIRENLAIINIDTKLPAGKQAAVMVHELGHAIWHKFVSKLTPEGRAKVDAAYQRMVEAKGPEQARKRFANSSNGATMKGMDNSDKYSMSRDEFSAEQYVKYIEDDVLHGNKLGLGEALKNALFEAVAKMVAFFTKAKQQGFVKAEPEYEAMFDSILRRQAAVDGNFGAATAGIAEARQLSKDGGTAEANAIVGDPELAKLGLDIAPVASPQQRAEVQTIKDLHDKAKNPEYAVDEKRLSALLNTAVFQGGQSVANTLLRSKNAVARMIAAMLVESPSGAAGRRGNAAISKALHEQAYLGNSINEVQFAYREYRQSVGGSLVEDTFGGKHWEEFNALVSRELEGRGRSQGVTSHPAVIKGADALEAAYERMRLSQLEVKTVGWASLPSTSKGYMPHRLSQEKIRNATNEQLQALHTALTDQFIRTQEFDASFSGMLASKYIDRVKHRALGGADTPAGATHIGSSDVVEEALAATGMTAEQVRATMQRLMKAGPGHTKKRLQLDLNQTYSTASGGEFKLGDLFEQDQFTLLRSQAARVSGEVSLTQYGVYGKAGLDLLRRAMTFGEDGPASKREFEAFDQIAAEFLGTPYGTQSKVIDRVLQANAVSRLGGMGFTQLAEFVNGAVHVGVGRTLDAVVGVPRLLGEIKALARGEEVQNGILTGMEKLYGGAEFGTQSYKTVFPFDNKSLDPHSYGEETITLMDRLLRGASHMQAKLSFWRAIHSAQQRGMAEQIVRKAAVFLREGQSTDVFLKDMGMSDDLLARMRAELPSIASWDAQGRLVELDVTRATDLDAAREFTQAVHRGVSQIIQGTFIGERSQWATDAHMRLLTQFRSFGLLAIEKQYGRQVGNVGEMKTLGILLGSMCAVLPIYAARMQLQSLGREDREEFLDKAFESRRVARQTMNYVAGSGLAGDFLDALGGLAGVNVGGRQGDREQEFVGNVVAPAAGLLDDAWKAVQNVQEGETNPQPAMKVLTNLPYLVPLINAMGD